MGRVSNRDGGLTEKMAEMKLNRKLIEKMIKRIETMPESYDQDTFMSRAADYTDRPTPACGTVACLAGEAIICSAPSVREGIEKLRVAYRRGGCGDLARDAMGLSDDFGIFGSDSNYWPEPYRSQWYDAKTYKGEARAAINLLRAILRTDGKILEG